MADIFISYTHRDNAKLSDEQYGWVDRFHEALEMRLSTLWGHRAEIWRDFKLQGNDFITPAIETSVAQSSILISVLSPGYIHSDWCSKELKLFCQAAQKAGGLSVGTKSRVVKVIKTPVERAATYSEIADIIGYHFYQFDQRGAPVEFDARFGDKSRQQFLAKVNELAYDICSVLETLTGKHSGRERIASPSGIALYLAETTSDLSSCCDQLLRELAQAGHTVLPSSSLSHSPDYVDLVRENLRRAQVSVHPIGTSYGIVPEGSRRSILELQYDAAGEERERRPELIRIPWMLPGTAPEDDRLRAFISQLQNDPRLLVTSLDNLKTSIAEVLASIAKRTATAPTPDPPQAPAGQLPPSVYLVFDRCDAAAAKLCEDALFSSGCEVISPLGSGSERELRLDHEENLKSCDAVLIYHGLTTEFWLRTKLRDLQKAFGHGRAKPFLAAAVLLASPDCPHKRTFRSNEVLALHAIDGFAPSVLGPFLERLGRMRSEAS